ncbi:hypothetical protein PHYSODRAFT_286232 [Phytophthora sojae]|uniref:RxLR effector protein n=1 Tax=Phytophthora sojae (strain P6497) TaxID=1094619 RepID=G4ZMF1_PHYSP|nr:hypothetical protein PHYSODRAFT_286232 [Phytophthora sojae]EGZ15004.1 hypothetical protein PHYSODRAFT_286232 [Phytophthora sojae]|eukprot:XP_009528753.1 hypothetical protein PHYSODRAFT_286232 [Phytophthora sojae]
MRPESIVLLAAAALLVCADGASAKSVAVDFPVTIHDSQDAIPTKRLLRSSEDSEERVGFDTLTGLAKAGASKVTGTTVLDTWLFHNVNGVQVLAKLQLGDDIAAALTSSKLKTLRKYIAMYNNKHTNTPTSLIETLTAHYGDDVVAKALAVAQKQPNTEALATQLRKNQMAIWMRKDRTGVDIFKLLSSGDDGYFTLTNLEILDDYIKLFNREKSAHETLLATLTTGIGSERRLAELLVVAKANPTTREKALELQSALFDKWLARKLRPETILRGLKLDDNVENALTNRNLQTLINYISVFNKNNPTSEATLIGTLIAHYGDDVVATALLSVKKVAGTKDMATVLQIQQLGRWFKSGKSVDVPRRFVRSHCKPKVGGAGRLRQAVQPGEICG